MNGQLAVDTREQRERCDTWLDELPVDIAGILREYQHGMIVGARDCIRRGVRRVLLQAHTGSGKSVVITAIVAAAVAAGLRVLILATRTKLVKQLHGHMTSKGIQHGIVAAAMPGFINWSRQVQIASQQTLYRRCLAGQKMPLPMAEVVLYDEAHLATSRTNKALLDCYQNAWVFGFTATPAKTNGGSLREHFDELLIGPSYDELVNGGHLVRPIIYNIPLLSKQELTSIKKDPVSGEFQASDAARVMNRPKLVGDVVQNWLRISNGEKTIVFACDKGHAVELLTDFRRAGVPSEMLTDKDEETTRDAVMERLEKGDTQVVINCFLMSYGVDIPCVECIVLARPMRSIVLYRQAGGRGSRPFPGKTHYKLIDHGRVKESLGRPDYDIEWTLDGNFNHNKAAAEKAAKEYKKTDEMQRTCGECACEWIASEQGNDCPACGWTFIPKAKPVQVQQAELVAGKDDSADWKEMDAFHAEACQWYANRWPDRWQSKPASGRFWAWSQTRKKFKRPDDERIPRRYWEHAPRPPGPVTDGYLKSQQIAWAKRQKAERGRAA